MKILKLIGIIALIGTIIFLRAHNISAQNCGNKDDCQKLIDEYEKKLVQVRQQKNTLSSQIDLMDTQISLTGVRILETESRIEKTQTEIESLGGKIEGLNTSLDYVGKILLHKIVEDYKRRDIPTFTLLLDSADATELLNRYKYARTVQENDRKLALQVQQAKLNFEQQKDLREKKKVELDQLKVTLDQQKVNLDNQKTSKQKLLQVTQNDETTYQSLIAQLRAENAAIQGIISGAGTETKVRDVKKGETIASIIPGSSCNSSGAHLHFIVQDGSAVVSPFSYLKPVGFENCSGSSCGSGDGDAFNPSGSWDWPIPPTIRMNQGFGETWAVRNTWIGSIYRFHNGIDITGDSYTVQAVADGTLYRGSYAVGCALQYAKVVHTGSNISTLYLHTYTQ